MKHREIIKTEEIAVLAVLSAISSAGRVIFTPLPNVQPSSFVIMMTGMIYGWKAGGIVGIVTALISNIFMGHGPWTFSQMLLWGLMGAGAGLLSPILKKHMIYRVAYAFVSAFLFGWGMNVLSIFYFFNGFNLEALIISSFYFDLNHALGNAAFMMISGKRVIHILTRVQKKYGLFIVRIRINA